MKSFFISKRKKIIFFTVQKLDKVVSPSSIQFVNSANASANLGYNSLLVFRANKLSSLNPLRWLFPVATEKPSIFLLNFYNAHKNLRIVKLPDFSFFISWLNKKISFSLLAKIFFLPRLIFPKTSLFYTRDLNFAEIAVKNNIPTIFEWDFPVTKKFDKNFAENNNLVLVVVNTNFIMRNLIDYGIPRNKLVQFHNGINSSFFVRNTKKINSWRNKFCSTENQKIVFYAGGLYDFKGVGFLIDVAAKMKETKFIFAGGNIEQVKHYKELSRKRKIKNVDFLGHVSHASLSSLLKCADVLAHPHLSTADAEWTSPLKFFEYLSSGTPIVATSIPALSEFRKKKLAVKWCRPDSADELEKCIKDIFLNFPRKKMGYLENIEFVKKFAWENRIKNIFKKVNSKYLPVLKNLGN